MKSILIGDVGATGSDWILIHGSYQKIFSLVGYNPVSQSEERLSELLMGLVSEVGENRVDIHYYGAGIGIVEDTHGIEVRFRQMLKVDKIVFASDLLGAAHALCGDTAGVVCILGTGSNACYYDGSVLTSGHSLGYPLGDEGSGMDIGKRLVKEFYYGLLPGDLHAHLSTILPAGRMEFLKEFKSKSAPNQYLANMTKYLLSSDNQSYAKQILKEAFTEFIKYHLYSIERNTKINAVGSIAFYFCGEFEKCLNEYQLQLGNVLQKPIDALVTYHLSTKKNYG